MYVLYMLPWHLCSYISDNNGHYSGVCVGLYLKQHILPYIMGIYHVKFYFHFYQVALYVVTSKGVIHGGFLCGYVIISHVQ